MAPDDVKNTLWFLITVDLHRFARFAGMIDTFDFKDKFIQILTYEAEDRVILFKSKVTTYLERMSFMKLKILEILTFVSATFLIQSSVLAQSLPFNIYQGPIHRGVRPWASLGQWIKKTTVQSSFMQVPGTVGLYMNVWTGQYYSVTPEGNIDLNRSGQNYEGSLAAWDLCIEGGGGDACMTRVDYRIKTILQTY